MKARHLKPILLRCRGAGAEAPPPQPERPSGEPMVAVSVIAASVALYALGCSAAEAPAVAGSAGLAGVNVARRIRVGGGPK